MGIFDNQEVQPVGTAVTPAEPIPDQSTVTALRGGKYADPLIEEMFTSQGDASKYDKNEQAKYQTLNNLDQTLTDLQKAKASNKISRVQASQNELIIAQRFKDDNPHLGKEIDDLVARRKNAYRAYDEATGKGNAVDQKMEQVDADLVGVAVNELGLIPSGESDPDKIAWATDLAQKYSVAKTQLKTAQENIAYTQSQLNVVSSKQGIEQNEITAATSRLTLDQKEAEVKGMQAAASIQKVALDGFSGQVDAWRYAINEAHGDPTRLAEIRQAVLDHQAKTRQLFANNPLASRMTPEMQKQASWGFDEQYRVLLEEADGKATSDIAKNRVDTVRNVSNFKYLTESVNGLKVSVAREFLGETGVSKLYGNVEATEFFSGTMLDNVTGQEDTTSSIIDPQNTNAKFIREIMPESFKVAAKYNGAPTTEDDKRVLAHLNTIMGSLDKDKIPDTDQGRRGKLQAITQFNKALAGDDAGDTFIRLNSQIKPEFKEKYTQILREQYSTPLFVGMRDMFLRLGDPAKYVNVTWQDGAVRMKPNENLTDADRNAVLSIINRKDTNAYLALVTDAVRADSHVHGNKDYSKKLDSMVADYFMVDPTRNLTPEKIAEVAAEVPQVNTQADTENQVVNMYVDTRNAYLDILTQRIAVNKDISEERKQKAFDDIKSGDLSNPLIARPLQDWYTKHSVSPEFVQRIDAAQALQKEVAAPQQEPATKTAPAQAPQEPLQAPTSNTNTLGSIRVGGETYLAPNEATVREMAKQERMTPLEEEMLVEQWKESVAQMERNRTGTRIKKGQ
jgi:hypothetical protein